VPAHRAKDGEHEDAEEFLGLYLDALDEELIELHTYITTHKPASAPRVEKLEGDAQLVKGQSEVRRRDFAVRLFSFLCTEFDVAEVCFDIAKFSRVPHVTVIWWKVPFDCSRPKPT
jgi:hypothetical protein